METPLDLKDCRECKHSAEFDIYTSEDLNPRMICLNGKLIIQVMRKSVAFYFASHARGKSYLCGQKAKFFEPK